MDKHLGKATSQAYLMAVEQVATPAKIAGLQPAIHTLIQRSADLMNKAKNYKQH